MKQLLIGLLVLGVIGGWWWRGRQQRMRMEPIKEGVEIEDRTSELARDFGVQLPDGVERMELRDVSGGSSQGLATREKGGERWEMTVLAALPDLTQGNYTAWLVKDEPRAVIKMGKLRVAKGGYLVEYGGVEQDYKRVLVTEELVDDMTPEKVVLEGVWGQ